MCAQAALASIVLEVHRAVDPPQLELEADNNPVRQNRRPLGLCCLDKYLRLVEEMLENTEGD